MRLAPKVMLWTLSLLCLVAIGLGVTDDVTRRVRLGKQVSTHGICQTYVSYLHEYHENNGYYPTDLAAVIPSDRQDLRPVIDSWGNPLHYESDGKGFVLASYGMKGKPDAAQFAHTDTVATFPLQYDICGNFQADEVVSQL